MASKFRRELKFPQDVSEQQGKRIAAGIEKAGWEVVGLLKLLATETVIDSSLFSFCLSQSKLIKFHPKQS